MHSRRSEAAAPPIAAGAGGGRGARGGGDREPGARGRRSRAPAPRPSGPLAESGEGGCLGNVREEGGGNSPAGIWGRKPR